MRAGERGMHHGCHRSCCPTVLDDVSPVTGTWQPRKAVCVVAGGRRIRSHVRADGIGPGEAAAGRVAGLGPRPVARAVALRLRRGGVADCLAPLEQIAAGIPATGASVACPGRGKVKYEMVRRVRAEGQPVPAAACS